MIFLACCVVAVGGYSLTSWFVADGLPLFTDWHYWAGLPIVIGAGIVAGWLLGALA